MIIGISGKKQSGKDTVATIIQYLFTKHRLKALIKYGEEVGEEYPNLEIFSNATPLQLREFRSGWQIKKYADKLKVIVSQLLGCSVEDLENEEFKNASLGDKWRVYYLGKKNNPGERVSKLYISKEELEANLTNLTQPKGYKNCEIVERDMTPRLLLQLLGTECGRNVIHPNIWINSLMCEYKPYCKGKAHDLHTHEGVYSHTSCIICKREYMGFKRQVICKTCIEDDDVQIYPNWLVTDVRFPNECDAIKELGGMVIRVERHFDIISATEAMERFDNNISVYALHKDGTESLVESERKLNFLVKNGMTFGVERDFTDSHESETALDNSLAFDAVIHNNTSLTDLEKQVEKFLQLHKLLPNE